jgi:D-alanyl-lipoteichoic acid acyltransferase DltB (MBOAT superfamily)
MSFTSAEFIIFCTIVFVLYWFVTAKDLKAQNLLLLFASYVFYGMWDRRFLFLLVLLSFANYIIGIEIDKNEADRKKKIWFIIGLITNIGVLVVFKYYNFFIQSFIDLVSLFGYSLSGSTTKIILPVGISFYVFLSLSYIIDIYIKSLRANRNITEVLLTLSFFPIIVAGPIQRPASLLGQITKRREFNYSQAVDGLRQILWGMFAKVVIADNLSVFVDDFFKNCAVYSGSTLLVGAGFYAIQIYADFSGYSNMAIGIGKLFGFNLMQNFAYPYFSRDISEFWRRWHISLTSWLRDYVFMPMSMAFYERIKSEKVMFIKSNMAIYIMTSAITWFLTGLWHGANYTFIIWGMINGLFLIVYQMMKSPRKKIYKLMGINNKNLTAIVIETIFTLIVITIAWVFFRSLNVHEAFLYLRRIFSISLFSIPKFPNREAGLINLILASLFFIIEWIGRGHQHPFADLEMKLIKPLRWAAYYGIVITILFFAGKHYVFIYSQF